MAWSVINFSMPERMRQFVEYAVKVGGYGSDSEYFRELVQKERWIDASETNTLIEERRASLGFRRYDLEEPGGWTE